MLNNKRTAFWVAALFALCGAATASIAAAQERGGVRSKGTTQLNVNTENVNTIASGQNNVARTNIGSVKGARQSTNVTVDVKNVTNVVGGRNKKGCVNIGVVGADPNCK